MTQLTVINQEIQNQEDISALTLIEYVYSKGNNLKTDSRKVAIAFEKQHKDVLRLIRNLECSESFTKRNFTLCYENNNLQNGKPQPYYEMSKDGFMFLVMGFTGRQAAKIKEAYIEAFNLMQGDLNEISNSLTEQLMQALINEKASQRLGSLGSQFMHKRRRDKIMNHQQIAELKSQIQPDLFNNLLV